MEETGIYPGTNVESIPRKCEIIPGVKVENTLGRITRMGIPWCAECGRGVNERPSRRAVNPKPTGGVPQDVPDSYRWALGWAERYSARIWDRSTCV